jgi:sugar fermentation stimulation protein A
MYRLPPLTDGTMIRRYKRFLADVQLPDGRVVTAHCPNTGSMDTCWEPGAPVQLSRSENPKRKLAWTLERIDMGRGWIGVNTGRVNHIVASAIDAGYVPQLDGYPKIRREPAFSVPRFPASRFDMLLQGGPRRDAYVEVKNTTLLRDESISFPDAVTERGRKHLELLAEAVKLGCRGVIVFALNRPEGSFFEPAWHIDPAYGATLERVFEQGVEIVALRLRHLSDGVSTAGSVHLSM